MEHQTHGHTKRFIQADIERMRAVLARVEQALTTARIAEGQAISRDVENAMEEAVSKLLECKNDLKYAITEIEDATI